MRRFERRVFLLALLVGLPGSLATLVLLWTGSYSVGLRWTASLAVVGIWIALARYLRDRVNRPLSAISSMLAALREGDFSIRARGAGPEDPLALTLLEVNALERMLREQRLGAVEATNLLQRVLAEIDVAVLAFDAERRLRLVNRAAERLVAASEGILGRSAAEVGLEETLEGEAPRTIERADPIGRRTLQVRRSVIRMEGERLTLVVLTDLSQALREEERQAWRRLVRVLSHEINNSLAPIASIAASVRDLVRNDPRPDGWTDDARRGLDIVSARAESLRRFMDGYARLARLPPPELGDVDLGSCIRHVATLETRLQVVVADGPIVTVCGDRDQLEQALINLVANGVDASLRTGGGVTLDWHLDGGAVEVLIEDEGPGVSDTGNLFVPFYTTKPEGTGVGLVLSQHIAENHGGSLRLENRKGGAGARARLVLPVRDSTTA